MRKQRGLSQEQIADDLNVSQSVYARIESGIGNSWAIYMDAICDFFNVLPEELVERASIEQENNHQKGGVAINQNMGTIQLSEKLIEQYEKRLFEKDEIIETLKKELTTRK